MFEKRDLFPWKTVAIVCAGVLVLSGGIFIGVKTRNVAKENPKAQAQTANTNKEDSKEVFELMEDCEIWVDKKDTDGKNKEENSMMIGIIPKELLNKTEGEIVSYFKDKYPDRKVESIGKSKIVLSEITKSNDPSKANKYTLEDNNGFISIYKYDSNGEAKLVEETTIKIDSLARTIQEEVNEGIILQSEEEAYSRLENFGS